MAIKRLNFTMYNSEHNSVKHMCFYKKPIFLCFFRLIDMLQAKISNQPGSAQPPTSTQHSANTHLSKRWHPLLHHPKKVHGLPERRRGKKKHRARKGQPVDIIQKLPSGSICFGPHLLPTQIGDINKELVQTINSFIKYINHRPNLYPHRLAKFDI